MSTGAFLLMELTVEDRRDYLEYLKRRTSELAYE